jgi:methionyl-tRNA formyltransferase
MTTSSAQISDSIVREGQNFFFKPQHKDQRLRVLLLCTDDGQQTYLRSLIGKLFDVVGVVIEPAYQQKKRLLSKSQYKRWIYRNWHIKRQKLSGRGRYRQKYFEGLVDGEVEKATIKVDWVGSQATVDMINRLKPDVTIVSGTDFIPSCVIDIAGLIINIHGGFLHQYRGNHGIFFAYYREDYTHIAVTLHLVTKAMDGGEQIDVVQPPIYPHDNDEHLYSRAMHHAMLRLVKHLQNLEQQQPLTVVPPKGEGEVFYHHSRKPWMDFLCWFRRKIGWQKVPHLPADNKRH